jgi:hypothetical protein
LVTGIPGDTRISTRFERKNGHPHPLAGIRGGLSPTISKAHQTLVVQYLFKRIPAFLQIATQSNIK